MEVILLQDVERLGSVGQRATVKNGYARNFLIPRGLAVPATASTRAQARDIQAAKIRAAQALKEKAESLAERLGGKSWTIPVSVGGQGKLHGAVTAADLLAALEREGLKLDRHQIELDKPLAQLGEFEVPVKLHPDVKASLKVCLVQR